VAVAATVAAWAAVVLPSAATYRRQASPPLRALEHAEHAVASRSGVLIVDRTLHSFVVYRGAVGRSASPVVFDHVIELGASPPPPPSRTVFVFDDGWDALLVGAESRRVFTCSDRVLRSLGQDRFLDLTVAEGSRLANRSGSEGPFVILD
jgi:hypothetical protein